MMNASPGDETRLLEPARRRDRPICDERRPGDDPAGVTHDEFAKPLPPPDGQRDDGGSHDSLA